MDEKIIRQLESLNKNIADLFLFLLCKEGYTKDQIRAILGKADNNRISAMRSGLRNNKAKKIQNKSEVEA